MSSPRHLLRHARLVLAVWLLSLGVAIAAPALRPVALEMVCSAGGMQLVERGDDGQAVRADGGAAPQVRGLLDCPLCAPVGAPPAALPPVAHLDLPAPRVAAAPAAVLQVRFDARAPARGPTCLSAIA